MYFNFKTFFIPLFLIKNCIILLLNLPLIKEWLITKTCLNAIRLKYIYALDKLNKLFCIQLMSTWESY